MHRGDLLTGGSLAANLVAVRARIARAGADPETIHIVAVTKGRPVEACRAAVALGLTTLGENRVQEALTKMDQVAGASWHLIGHLQTNKVRKASRFDLIQSVDSVRLAEMLARSGRMQALLEVNLAGEPRRHGVAPEVALEVAARVAGLLDLRGLMGMGPLGGDAAPAFRELRRLRDEAQERLGQELPVLSMGMSEDFESAVREGSTMVRLGRVLFGFGAQPPG